MDWNLERALFLLRKVESLGSDVALTRQWVDDHKTHSDQSEQATPQELIACTLASGSRSFEEHRALLQSNFAHERRTFDATLFQNDCHYDESRCFICFREFRSISEEIIVQRKCCDRGAAHPRCLLDSAQNEPHSLKCVCQTPINYDYIKQLAVVLRLHERRTGK